MESIPQLLEIYGVVHDFRTALTQPCYIYKSFDEIRSHLDEKYSFLVEGKIHAIKLLLKEKKFLGGEKLIIPDFVLLETVERLQKMIKDIGLKSIKDEDLKMFEEYAQRVRDVKQI